MKKYHTLLVVAITILVVALLTWILPITYYSGDLIAGERVQAGIVSTATYGLFTFYNFIYVFAGLLFVGGLYGILNKVPAYRVLLDKLVKFVKNHKVLCLVLTVLLLSIIVAFTGLTFEMLVFLPLIAAVVLLLGYDKIIAAMVTVGSVSVGVIGSLFSKPIVGKLNEVLETPTYKDLIAIKVAILVVCAVILILNIILKAKKSEVKETVEESFLVPKKVTSKKVKVWPLATIAIVATIVMVLAAIDWQGAFGVVFFNDALTTIKAWPILSKYIILTVSVLVILYNVLTSLYKRMKADKKDQELMSKRRKIVTIVFGVIAFLALLKIMLEDVFKATQFMTKAIEAIKLDGVISGFTFDKLFGSVAAFGSWTYNDYMILLLLVCLAIKFAYHVKFSEILDNLGEGFKNVLYGCFVVLLSYTVLILVSGHPIGLTIIKPLLEATKGLHIVLYPISTLFSALFNTDFAYYEYGVLNVAYVTTAYTGNGVIPFAEFITQTMYGFAMFIAPTSVVLLFTLSILDIKYTTWLKKVLFVILEILLVLFLSYVVLNLWVI
jgi:uncharacterized ion transporter superfamily protein YfcC